MFQDSNTKELSKTCGKPLFCKAPVQGTAVSSVVLPLSANEFAARGRASADSPGGLSFTEKKNNKNLSVIEHWPLTILCYGV